jgi:hypothetical protein
LVMLTGAGATTAGRGRTLIRAVSCFGPRFIEGVAGSAGTGGTGRTGSPPFPTPGGLGSGWSIGELLGEIIGGRRGRTGGGSGLAPDEGNGVIFGGGRRIGVTGVREGRTMRAVSRFTSFAWEAFSGRGGSAMRTVSFFGSAMSSCVRERKSHKRAAAVTRFVCENRKFEPGPITPAGRSHGCR